MIVERIDIMPKKQVCDLACGDIGIIALKGCMKFAKAVDVALVEQRNHNCIYDNNSCRHSRDSFIIPIEDVRFSNGEAKVRVQESVRGMDIFIFADVGNHSITYDLFGFDNHMGPDEHFQDIKRVIAAISGSARRYSVIMPLLYASRQHKRHGRESLDCALALQELVAMGTNSIITFDAHDPRVNNAIPLTSMENFYATSSIIKAFLTNENDIDIDNDSMLIISPDTGGMDRAVFYASMLGLDVGLFYKRRDLSKIVNGSNPVVMHEYMGASVKGKNIFIVDDMIASGGSIFDTAKQLKLRGAANIYAAATFALFTEGVDEFERSYNEGLIEKFYITNLSYVPKSIKNHDWYIEVDLSAFMADIVNRLNCDASISSLFEKSEEVKAMMEKKREES